MAIAYSIIRRECFLRSSQLKGVESASLEAAYVGAAASALNGSEIPLSSFKAQIINIESELTHIIASDASHPYRTYIYGASASLANLAATPDTSAAGDPFVGVFDSVVDGSTGQPLTLQPTESLLDFQDSFFDNVELYNYCIVGNTIQHSRSGAIMQGCVFNRTTAETDYDADGNSPLPPVLANTWIAGVMANIGQVGWTDGAGVTGMYNGIYQQGLQILREGSNGQVNLPLASQASPIAG